MRQALFEKLAGRDLLTAGELDELVATAHVPPQELERLIEERGVPRHELLGCLSEAHGRPFVEFDESVGSPRELFSRLDAQSLKANLWFPLSVEDGLARVIAWNPADPAVLEDVEEMLGVSRFEFWVALPSDIVRMIEHNLDVNPGFPAGGARTPLAKVRTFLAESRSQYACIRTSLARGRTGLAILRTGLSFVTIAIVLYRVFGPGLVSVLEAALTLTGAAMVVEGLRWYVAARRSARQRLSCDRDVVTKGTTVLQAKWSGEGLAFTRTGPIPGGAELRSRWTDLSPVMRRRYLASDRTDLAEERTSLACLRTKMARARTGLAFTRTGIAFAGVGMALFRMREFQTGWWPIFDAGLVLAGAAMTLEGFLWYFLDRRAGSQGHESVRSADDTPSIWEAFFPPRHRPPDAERGIGCSLPVAMTHAPGIWGTTGLALERTMLADRRNVMARLRTVMARSRTGLAFVRTGMSLCGVGIGLLVYFGFANVPWAALDVLLVAVGALLIGDGLYWHLPAEKLRTQLPYCFCDVEITVPDYGKPARSWGKAVFSHDDL